MERADDAAWRALERRSGQQGALFSSLTALQLLAENAQPLRSMIGNLDSFARSLAIPIISTGSSPDLSG